MSDPPRRWTVKITKQPEKMLRRLPQDLRDRIDKAIRDLETNPWPRGHTKLTGYDNLYRVRVGDWRISYAVECDQLIVLILEVTTRGGAYRF